MLASLFKGFGISPIALNLIESVIRVSILLLYMYLVSKLDDIYRVFQYHGAEHKTIFCYENEEKLTVENVKKHSRFHPRCGTNFLFLTMFVSIIIFSLAMFTYKYCPILIGKPGKRVNQLISKLKYDKISLASKE